VLLDLIETIYLCGSGNAHWQEFLDQFGRRFPALKLALTGYDNLFSNIDVLCNANFDPHFVASFAAYYFKINPWQNVVISSPPAPIVGWAHEAVPIRELEKTEFYAGWVKPQDNVATGFSTMLVKEKGRFVNLSANVNPKYMKEAKAAARDIAVVGPHLRRAFELYRQLHGARVQQDGYQSVLNALLAAVFIVDANGSIQFANAKGECLLREERVVKSSATGRLCFVDSQDDRAVTESMRRAAMRLDGGEREIIPLHVAVPGHHLAFVTALSMQRDAPARRGSKFFLPVAPIAVFIVDSSEMPQAELNTVARALKVTRAEARLTLALLHDKNLKQYADENAVSFHTARAQMRSLLEKTGTHRQAALLRLITHVFAAFDLK